METAMADADSVLGEGGPLEPPVGDSVFSRMSSSEDDDLPAPQLKRYQYTITDSDNLYTALQCFNVPHELIMSWCNLSKDKFDLTMVKPGQSFFLYAAPDKEFVRLEYNINGREQLVISKDADGYRARKEALPDSAPEADDAPGIAVPAWISPGNGYRYYRGIVTGNFYDSALAAGMSPNKAMAVIHVLAGVNFARKVKEGDRFSVVTAPGKNELEEGPILAAMVETGGKPHYSFRYEEGGKARYYDREGKSFSSNRLLCPVRYARVSSGFTRSRLHPILHQYRPHLGIDYAAPTGTPVHAAADGRVVRTGYDRGFGNTILLQHNGEFQTQYGHLSRYAKGIQPGVRVKQGQTIGYVGMTGLATGPHLDYRVFRNGQPVNPLAVTSMPGPAVKNRTAFNAVKENMVAELMKSLPLGPPAPWPPTAVASAAAVTP